MNSDEYMVNKSLQEILYKIDNCINERSGWEIESINEEYVKVSVFDPLSGSKYIKLPNKLKNSVKNVTNIKSNDNKCFLWCHITHLDPLKISPERIKKADKNMVADLDYEDIKFPVSKKHYSKIEQKSYICINGFCFKNDLVYSVYV